MQQFASVPILPDISCCCKRRFLKLSVPLHRHDDAAVVGIHAADAPGIQNDHALDLRSGKNQLFHQLRALRRILPELEYEIVPGVNSWSALAAASGTALAEDSTVLRVVPSHLPPDSPELHRMLESGESAVLLKTYHSRNEYLDALAGESCDILYGSNIGLKEQFISSDPAAIRERPDEYLSMLIIRKEKKS